jgi:hypothetical protein
LLDRFNYRFEHAEERISKLEYRSFEIIASDEQKEKRTKWIESKGCTEQPEVN